MKKETLTEENIVFTDYRESILFDSGAPVFVADKYYTTAHTLEGFKTCFSHMSEEYLRTEHIGAFKSLFKQAARHYGYPKEEAKRVLDDCINKMNLSRNIPLSV